MRQWELIGITDTVPTPQAPPPPRSRFANAETIGAAAEGRPVFFWSTDTALRVRTVTGAATEAIGLSRLEVSRVATCSRSSAWKGRTSSSSRRTWPR